MSSGARIALALPIALFVAACDGPGNTLARDGVSGTAQARLGTYLLVVACVVVLVIGVLLLMIAWRARAQRVDARTIIASDGHGLNWIMIGGIVVPSIILTVTFVLTLVALNASAEPSRGMVRTVHVIGHQWWWEVRYEGPGAPDEEVVTANELHVPVGEPVRVTLDAADVIHSFWVPRLAGKMDVIPGQTNVTWIEARSPGDYTGRCGEYCGMEHAQMELRVIAEPPAQFDAWLAAQRAPAGDPGTPAAAAGEKVFLASACATCHTIRGTSAGGAVGPDLTHLASRITIGAGALPNTRGNLAGWIANAQGVKPGVRMPTMAPRPAELQQLVEYLESLH